MYEQVEKSKENKSRAVANSVTQKKNNGRQGFGFVDNRARFSFSDFRTSKPLLLRHNMSVPCHIDFTTPTFQKKGRVSYGNTIQRAQWLTEDVYYKWDELLDGVQWYADSEGQMWFRVVRPRDVVKGNLSDYMSLEDSRKTWSEWNSISVEPYIIDEIGRDLSILEHEESLSEETSSPKAKIMKIAAENRTSGLWFAWGPKKYMIQWTTVGNVLNHALNINSSTQGSGLYLGVNSWRSSTYATQDAYLLIAKLSGVPTIDIRNKKQMDELSEIGLSDQDLYKTENLTEMLFLYTSNGNFARLTATQGVELITDLGKPALKAQAKDYGLDIDDWN